MPTSTVEDDDNETIDANETDSEPVFDEEDVKGFEKDPDKDLDDEKNLFVSFDDMDFCVIGPNQAPPSFNSYDMIRKVFHSSASILRRQWLRRRQRQRV